MQAFVLFDANISLMSSGICGQLALRSCGKRSRLLKLLRHKLLLEIIAITIELLQYIPGCIIFWICEAGERFKSMVSYTIYSASNTNWTNGDLAREKKKGQERFLQIYEHVDSSKLPSVEVCWGWLWICHKTSPAIAVWLQKASKKSRYI